MKIVVLQNESQILPAAKILTDSYFDSLKEARDYIGGKLKTKECLVAIEQTEVVGVLVYYRSYSHYANYIGDLAIAMKYKRKGIAMQLLKRFIELSKKETPKKQIYVLSSTKISNKISRRMHLKCGFKEIGRLKGLHYGEDEVFFAYTFK